MDAECQEIQDVLDVYVDDERAGLDAQARYPAVWEHLQACAGCRLDYDTLTEILSAPADVDGQGEAFPTPRAPLSFLRTERDDQRWRTHVRSRLAGAPLSVKFVIGLAHLREVIEGFKTRKG